MLSIAWRYFIPVPLDSMCRTLGAHMRRAARRSGGKAASNSGKALTARSAARRPSAIVPRAMSRRIAIVEDEPAIRANYADALRKHGYEVAAYASRARSAGRACARACPTSRSSTSAWATTSTAASRCAASCARCRATLPIIFLTARDSDFDIVSGLRLGADDYLTKDVSLPHLLARIAALFRRVELLARAAAGAGDASSAARWRST